MISYQFFKYVEFVLYVAGLIVPVANIVEDFKGSECPCLFMLDLVHLAKSP